MKRGRTLPLPLRKGGEWIAETKNSKTFHSFPLGKAGDGVRRLGWGPFPFDF